MNRRMSFLLLFMISCLIDRSFSAIHWTFRIEEFQQEYHKYRSASVHRGVLLSYSAEQKNCICRDLYSAQLYYKDHPKDDGGPIITDGETKEGAPQHRLTVREFPTLTNDLGQEEIFFRCVGKDFSADQPVDRLRYQVSTAYRSGWLYLSTGLHRNTLQTIPKYIAGLAPEFVEKSKEDVETQYARIRETLDILKAESPRYVELIEQKDELRALGEWKQRLLCASILSSSVYKDERLEIHLDWVQERSSIEREVELSFKNDDYAEKDWIANCIVCKATPDYHNGPYHITDLYLTPSLDNQNSVYVLKPENENIYLNKYFVRAPILINAKARIFDSRNLVLATRKEFEELYS